jgi:integrase
MARKPTLRRAGGYWYTQAGARDGVYFGRVADVPYKVARARFGEYLAGLSRAPLPTLDLPDRSVAEVCSLHLTWALKHRSKNLFSQRKCLLNGLCNYRVGDHEAIRLPGAGLLIGELRADRLVRAHIEAYLEHRRTTPSSWTGKPFGDKALRHVVVAVKAAWNWAADPLDDGGGGLLPPDHRPFRKLPRGFVQPKDLSENELPTDEEIASLRRWCPVDPDTLPENAEGWQADFVTTCSTHDSRVFADLMLAYHATGARTSELCQALVSDFMPRTKQVCLGKHKRVRTQHNSTVRNIQVGDVLLETLANNVRGKKGSDPLFAHEDGRHWNQNEVNGRLRAIRAVATKHGDPVRNHITPYSFRDLYISELLMIGVEPFKVAKMAGTSLKEIDRTYGHFFNHDLAEAQERLAASRVGRF